MEYDLLKKNELKFQNILLDLVNKQDLAESIAANLRGKLRQKMKGHEVRRVSVTAKSDPNFGGNRPRMITVGLQRSIRP
jgi:hypothetical protein